MRVKGHISVQIIREFRIPEQLLNQGQAVFA
jgi:hypothetical protein